MPWRKGVAAHPEVRVPIVRLDEDGTIIDGTARMVRKRAEVVWSDFRDLDGNQLILPPGSAFEMVIEA